MPSRNKSGMTARHGIRGSDSADSWKRRTAQKRKSPARRVSARAVSGKRPVLTGRGRESEAKTESRPAIEPSGINKKGPPERLLRGPVNPAATYSPGPGGQVPSAI